MLMIEGCYAIQTGVQATGYILILMLCNIQVMSYLAAVMSTLVFSSVIGRPHPEDQLQTLKSIRAESSVAELHRSLNFGTTSWHLLSWIAGFSKAGAGEGDACQASPGMAAI